MLAPGERLLLAVSGGADSVALMRLALIWSRKHDLELEALHVEHGLRGRESLEDAAWVRSLCGKYGLECRMVSVDVRALARAEGRSEEEAARILRYRALEEEADRLGGAKIALAHNANDQAETLLFHLARGSGLDGLAGMPAKRGNIVRPLLTTPRAEIEAWLGQLGQDWRRDRTNEEDVYSRNRIRHRVLPHLLEENRRALEHILRTAEIAREASAHIRQEAEGALSKYLLSADGQEGGSERLLPRPAAISLSLALREEDLFLQKEVLRLALQRAAGRKKDLGYEHMQALLALLRAQAGKQLDLPHDLLVVRGYESLQFFKKEDAESRTPVGEEGGDPAEGGGDFIPGDLSPGDGGVIALGRDRYRYRLRETAETEVREPVPYTKAFDYDKIRSTLRIRLRRAGDRICIDAAGHRKSLKRFMIDQKIPAGLRDSCPLLADGAEVVWLIGYRQSQAYRVAAGTRRILEIRRMEDEREDQSDAYGGRT